VAGHSLGEYSALVAAGSIDFADALRTVRKRGQYMQEAVPAGVGAMAAILKLPAGKLDEILVTAAQGEIVTIANLNSPDQVVIAGNKGAVERAMELAKAAGAKRAIPLPVSAPFHCPLMQPAQQRLRVDLDAIEFRDLRIPLINNWQAAEIRTGALGGIHGASRGLGRRSLVRSGCGRSVGRTSPQHRSRLKVHLVWRSERQGEAEADSRELTSLS